jgi:hypothetical protein
MFLSKRGTLSLRGRHPIPLLLSICVALFVLALFSPAADIPCVWTGVERIVAVGDLHGDFDNFVTILKKPKVGLVDENLHWIGGKTHLVQIGDVLDRGDHAKEIFDLLMSLEKEAAAAGGMVHVLLGNHEEINITGIALSYPGYVFVDQFFSFLPEDFKTARWKEYLSRLPADEQAKIKTQGLDIAQDPGYRAFWEKILDASKKARGRDKAGQAYTDNFNRTYGQWLLKKNVAIRINDVVFAHAGFNLQFSTWKLKDLNDAFRTELEAFAVNPMKPHLFGQELQPQLVYNSESPLWLRAMERDITQGQMDKILANLKASKMVIGHNYMAGNDSRSPVVPAGDVIPLFHGKVWMIDTGIGETLYGGRLYALIIKNGEFDHYAESEEAAPANPNGPQAEEGPKAADEIEHYLAVATPVFVMQAGGRTEPWRVRLDYKGVKRWAQFKYINRPRPEPLADSYKYELASYKLDKYLGLGLIPPVVERIINNFPGSLQIFVEDAVSEQVRKSQDIKLGDPKVFERTMADLKVFVNLVSDTWGGERDRDILIQRTTGKVYAVGFSRAFVPRQEAIPGCEILTCSRSLYGKLLNWDNDKVKALVAPYLNGEEIHALQARVVSILRTIKKLVETRGEGAVLF